MIQKSVLLEPIHSQTAQEVNLEMQEYLNILEDFGILVDENLLSKSVIEEGEDFRLFDLVLLLLLPLVLQE